MPEEKNDIISPILQQLLREHGNLSCDKMGRKGEGMEAYDEYRALRRDTVCSLNIVFFPLNVGIF